MKTFWISLLILMAVGTSAQESESLSPEFKQYLSDNNLWDIWRANRLRFVCLQRKPEIPMHIDLQPKDSLAAADALKTGTALRYEDLSPETSAWALQQRAMDYEKKQEKDSSFFRRMQLNVLNILQRFPPQIRHRSKIMVVDITASMSPYAEQVLLWQQMHLEREGYTEFVFFNDGDDKLEDDKYIGSTGGIYKAAGGADSLVAIVAQMKKGMLAGGGGAAPENDLEALLVAQSQWDSTRQDIILIADAKCPVRDLSLITKLKVPVRVILCGVESLYGNNILIDYMLIAYLTKGSIHTLKDDNWGGSPQMEGKIVYLDGKPYLVENRALRKLTREEAELKLQYKKWD